LQILVVDGRFDLDSGDIKEIVERLARRAALGWQVHFQAMSDPTFVLAINENADCDSNVSS
jgi:hypothetical protein